MTTEPDDELTHQNFWELKQELWKLREQLAAERERCAAMVDKKIADLTDARKEGTPLTISGMLLDLRDLAAAMRKKEPTNA